MIGNACYAGYTTAHATCYLVVGSKHFVSQGNSNIIHSLLTDLRV